MKRSARISLWASKQYRSLGLTNISTETGMVGSEEILSYKPFDGLFKERDCFICENAMIEY